MKAIKVGLVLLLVLVTAGSIVSLVIATNASTNEKLKLPQELTEEELQELYKKYSITENDIKFAKGELPHYLKGTILYDKEVIAIEGGFESLPDDMKRNLEKIGYDVIISKEQMLNIVEKARNEYIKKYGVDPANPKVDIVNGVPVPREYIKELIKNGKIYLKDSEVKPLSKSIGTKTSATGPQQINEEVWVYISKGRLLGAQA